MPGTIIKKNTGRDWFVINMPSEFYDDIFKTVGFGGEPSSAVDIQDYLGRVFEGNRKAIDCFLKLIDEKAGEISGTSVGDEWAVAEEEGYIAFFLYPKDNSKLYRVGCNQPTISKYYKFRENYGTDENGCIIVDNVMFGLIVTLAVFDTYGNSHNRDIIAAYVDSAQHIHNSINEVADSFPMKPSLDLDAFDKAMTIMHNHYGMKYDSSDYH